MQNAVDKISIRGKAGIVPIIDMRARHLVASLIGAFTRTAGLDIATIRQELMADVTVFCDPKAT